MKVSGVGRGSAASGKRTSKTGTTSDAFVRHLDEGKEAGGVDVTEEAGASEALASIGNLLSLQSVDPDAGGEAPTAALCYVLKKCWSVWRRFVMVS